MDDRLAASLAAVAASTSALVRTLAGLSDDDVRRPSLLPGWSRGHVLTHVARNADALGNLVGWARTGVETPMYSSREQRAEDIEAGAGRSAAELVADVTSASDRLLTELDGLGDEAWATRVRWGFGGREGKATGIPALRRIEVEIHHVDLDLDYTLAHLPPDFVLWLIARVAGDLSERDDLPGFVLVGNDNEGSWTVGDGGREVTGTPPSLLGWLIGRTDGIGVHTDGGLPPLGPWR